MSGFVVTDDKGAIQQSAALGAGVAPNNATYITQVAESGLTAEQALAALATGLVKNTTSTGVLSIAGESDIESALGSHAANEVLATPDGSSGDLSPRALVVGDLPSQLGVAVIVDDSANYNTNSNTFVSIGGSAQFFADNLQVPSTAFVAIFDFDLVATAALRSYFDLFLDGVQVLGNDGKEVHLPNSTDVHHVCLMFPVAGISPGAHDIELKWRVSTSSVSMYTGAGTSGHDTHPTWTIMFLNF
jgi:hypothetical protein